MRVGIWAAIAAAATLAHGTGWAGCLPGQGRDCVNFDLVPKISQQIVADEHIPVPPKRAPALDPQAPYTGPTIGINKRVRRAPEIGYRWAIN